jgi:hypothetical protein
LCSACANTMNQGHCTHSDKERCIIGSCLTDEFRKAVDMGYGLVEVFELWTYSVTCFDKDTNSGGLFAEYVNRIGYSSLWPLFCIWLYAILKWG